MLIVLNFENSDEALNDTTSASFAVSAFSLNRLRDPACSTTTFLPSKHMELLLRMARLGRTHSVIKLLLMYIEHPHIIGHRKLSVDSLIVVCTSKSPRILDVILDVCVFFRALLFISYQGILSNFSQMVDSLLMQACALDEETKSRLKSAIESICERGPSEKIKWNDGVYPRSFP